MNAMGNIKNMGAHRVWLAGLALYLLAAWVMPPPACAAAPEDGYLKARLAMVHEQIKARGVQDPAVLKAMQEVPRHLFVPESLRDQAYADHPLPIGQDQTISQPFIVAYMTEALKLKGNEKVLEIGTGSGYQAAILARIAKEVYSMEILRPLYEQAQARLAGLGFANVHLRAGDGYLGWPEKAPFDAIMVTAAPEEVPPKLVEQLKPGGRMVLPVGRAFFVQKPVLLEKDEDGRVRTRTLELVRFVPMVRGK
jgi:protein-L-isoaspartate(D-aspartate) O-methyltransferase